MTTNEPDDAALAARYRCLIEAELAQLEAQSRETAADRRGDRRGPPRTAANHCKPVGGTLKSLWLLAVQIAFARFFCVGRA